MKNNLKKINQLLFLFATLLLASCSKDNFEDDSLIPENSQNKRTIKEYNFNEANKQPKFFIGYSKIKKGISKFSTNSTSKVVPRDVNFTIDTTTIKEITNGNIKTYTMLISRPEFNNSYFENLVIKVDEQDSIKAYITTYFPERNSEYHEEHDSYTFHGTSSIREIEYDPAYFNLNTVEPFECHMVYYCNWGGQQHVAGDNCSNTYGLLDCSGGGGGGTGSGGEGSGGDGGSEGGGGSGSSGTGSSGSGTSGTTTTTPVITDTAPVVPFRNLNLVIILSLDTTQATWINSATNAAVKRALQEYMYYNPTNVSFGVDIVNLSKDLEINAMDVWKDYELFRAQMSNDERNIFDNMLINRRLMYIVAAKKAINETEERYPTTAKNGTGDAFRHALWNGMSSLLIGENLTEQLTTAHETRPSDYTYTFKEKDMDLYNNLRGRQITNYSNVFTITDNVVNYLQIGGLRFLNNLDNNSLATYNSVLVPTN